MSSPSYASWTLKDAITFEALVTGLDCQADELARILDKPKHYLERFLGRRPKETIDRFSFRPEIVSYEVDGQTKKVYSVIMRIAGVRQLVSRYLATKHAIDRLRDLSRAVDAKHKICRMIYLECKLNMRAMSPVAQKTERKTSRKKKNSSTNPLYNSLGTRSPKSPIPENDEASRSSSSLSYDKTFIKAESCSPQIEELLFQPQIDHESAISGRKPGSALGQSERKSLDHGNASSRKTDDWTCNACNNLNYQKKTFCYRCDAPRDINISSQASSTESVRSKRHSSPSTTSVMIRGLDVPGLEAPLSLKGAGRRRDLESSQQVSVVIAPRKKLRFSTNAASTETCTVNDMTEKQPIHVIFEDIVDEPPAARADNNTSYSSNDASAIQTTSSVESLDSKDESVMQDRKSDTEFQTENFSQVQLTTEQWRTVQEILSLTASSEKTKALKTVSRCLYHLVGRDLDNLEIIHLMFRYLEQRLLRKVLSTPIPESGRCEADLGYKKDAEAMVQEGRMGMMMLRAFLRLQNAAIEADHDILDWLLGQDETAQIEKVSHVAFESAIEAASVLTPESAATQSRRLWERFTSLVIALS